MAPSLWALSLPIGYHLGPRSSIYILGAANQVRGTSEDQQLESMQRVTRLL